MKSLAGAIAGIAALGFLVGCTALEVPSEVDVDLSEQDFCIDFVADANDYETFLLGVLGGQRHEDTFLRLRASVARLSDDAPEPLEPWLIAYEQPLVSIQQAYDAGTRFQYTSDDAEVWRSAIDDLTDYCLDVLG